MKGYSSFAKVIFIGFVMGIQKYLRLWSVNFRKDKLEKTVITFAKDILMEFSTDRYKYSHFMELTFAKISYM